MYLDTTGIPRWARPWSGLSVQLTGGDRTETYGQVESKQGLLRALHAAARRLKSQVQTFAWSRPDWRHSFAVKRLSDEP
jgi:hypothetical protein